MSNSLLKTAFMIAGSLVVGGLATSATRQSNVPFDHDDRNFLLKLLDRSVRGKDLASTQDIMGKLIERHAHDKTAQLEILAAFSNSFSQWGGGVFLTEMAQTAAMQAKGTAMDEALQHVADKYENIWPLPKPPRTRPVLKLVCNNS